MKVFLQHSCKWIHLSRCEVKITEKCLILIFVPKIASLKPFLLQLKTVLITVISELANTRIVFNNNEKLILGAKIQTQINETFLRIFKHFAD